MMIRQGDVLLRRIKTLPESAKPVDGPVIVEYGEVTGHAHRIMRGATMFRDDGAGSGGQYLVVGDAPAELTHEEHSTALLDAGTIWERLPQSEYTPAAIVRVVD